ncbi:MAG: 7-carboxy-7-deazaguanine synthase QueE, partial [Lentisphaeria bacterium]|nr:7-carboxy-7-deazaguanine synthase QueE [Lentisphaeria bacterium]
GLDLIELTGGEPLMQKDVPALATELIRLGKTVLIETNGSRDCSVLPQEVHRIIDYKTPCSGEEAAMLEQNFRSLRHHDQVKFVIADDTDYDCAVRCLEHFNLTAQTSHILFSPAWGSDLRHLTERIVHDKLPVRLNLQFHKIIWGADSEGV